jgi:hypothetical protein
MAQRLSLLLVLLLFFGSRSYGMQNSSLPKDELLHFNTAGFDWDARRSTIEQFGGDYLNALVSGKYEIARDDRQRIYIDRPPREAEYIQTFMLTQQLPTNFDENVARSAAKFFCLDQMIEYIDEQRPKTSAHRYCRWKYPYPTCPECEYGAGDLFTMAIHLIDTHKAQIECTSTRGEAFDLMYRVPLSGLSPSAN